MFENIEDFSRLVETIKPKFFYKTVFYQKIIKRYLMTPINLLKKLKLLKLNTHQINQTLFLQ